MFNIENHWIEIECPNCNYQIDIQLIDLKNENIVYCHSCKRTIQLEDKNASTHTSLKEIDDVLDDLKKVFKNLVK